MLVLLTDLRVTTTQHLRKLNQRDFSFKHLPKKLSSVKSGPMMLPTQISTILKQLIGGERT
jgi:hypothetical protein